jgi:hypothetical protein
VLGGNQKGEVKILMISDHQLLHYTQTAKKDSLVIRSMAMKYCVVVKVSQSVKAILTAGQAMLMTDYTMHLWKNQESNK